MAVDHGTDISCVSDVDAAAVEVSGRLCLAQAIARRLTTPRGRLLDDPNYGYDLTQFVNDDLAPADLAKIRAFAEAECLKDERVRGVTITLTLAATGVLVVTVALVDGDGPFTLVLSVTSVTATLLNVQ